MDRNREARRSAMAASNGLSRRRQRSSGLRESLDDGHMEMHEGVRLRDRAEKRERDRDSLNRSKRRRSERFSQRNETEEESSDESLGCEELPRNTTAFQQSHRKSYPPVRLPRQAATPSLKVADEMIGVPVPRKARSVCVKRSLDCRTSSGSGGFGEDHRQAPASPASHSFEAGSPSSSNVSVKQRMPNGSKSLLPKPSKSSGSAEDDLEMEIAEVLFGLKQQPESSKNEDNAGNSLKSSEFRDVIHVNHETGLISSNKTKMEAEDFYAPAESSSITECPVKTEISMAKSEKVPSVKSQVEAIKLEKSKSRLEEESSSRDIVENIEKFNSQDSTVTKGVSEVPEMKSQREDYANNNKFRIDLMAPPSMPSSPERDTFFPLPSDSKPIVTKDYKMNESLVKEEEKGAAKKEIAMEEGRENKVENREWLKLDLDKPSQDDDGDNSIKLQNQGQSQQPAKATAPKPEKASHPGSAVPLPIAGGGWPNSLPPLGCEVPFQTIRPIEGFTGSCSAVPPAPCATSQPCPKRCATHYYIARNIQLHQQFVKTNHLWPVNTGSVSLSGGGSRQNNLYVIPPHASETLIHGNPSLQGDFTVLNQNSSAHDKGKIVANVPTQKDKASESAHFAETAQKQQQCPAAAVSNLLPGPAFIFPIRHHQQPVSATTNQYGPSKSVPSTKNPSLTGSSTSVSFKYPGSASNEAPQYLTKLQNNGYQFPVRAGTPGQALPFFNGSFYSPQMLHPSQLHLHQQAPRDTSISSGSSSSHKQMHSQVGGNNNLLSSTNVQKQHLPSSSHQSHKLEAKISGDNSSAISDSRVSHCQKSVYGQSFTVPLQPLNFSMSFGSINGSGTSSDLNFSSTGYHIAPAPHAAQQKNHQITDLKTDDGKKGIRGKSPAITNGQTLVFDNSARTLSFVSGSWPPHAITASSITSNSPVSTNLPNTQQLQIQKHHLQQQQSGRSRSMATDNPLPASSIAAKFPNNVSVFPQTHAQVNSVTAQSAQWKSPAAASSLLSASSSSSLKQFQTQQRVRTQGGQTQISFAGNSKPGLVQPHGQQQIPTTSQSQSQSSLVVGSPPHSKTNSSGSNKTGSSVPAAQSQQNDCNPATGSGQKSSPVCGRNVRSIISPCPSHLSELKY